MQSRVPVVDTIVGAWTDAIRAVRAMPVVVVSALAIYAVLAAVMYFAGGTVLKNPGRSLEQWLASPTWFVFHLFNTSLQIVLLAPLVMAIHRYIIRGEAARHYPLHPLRPSYLHYVGVVLALNCLCRVPDLARVLVQGVPIVDALIWLGTIPLVIALVLGALRKVALLAAIAANGPNANWGEFPLADGGNTFRIVLVLFVVLIPRAIAGILLNAWLPVPNWPHDTGGLVLTFSLVLVQVLILIVFGTAVARIYMAVETPAADVPAPARVEALA